MRFAILATVLAGVLSASGENWPAFRGPGGTGVGETCAETWSSTDNIAWKQDIAGRGWSSPVVWDGKVFLTTAVGKAQMEAPKKGLYFGGERPDAPPVEQDWRVICLDMATGTPQWETSVHQGPPRHPIHIKNSYASETPVTDGKHLYVCFGGVGIYCLDLAGKIVWEHQLPKVSMRYGWGTAAGPALHGDRLYYVSDNEDSSYLLALDTATGAEVWRTPRDEKSNWAPPFIWEADGRAEIVTAGSGAVRGYDLDGKERWSLRGMSTITIAQPYAAEGLLWVTSGYVGDKLKPVYAIKPGATGDITLADGETSNAHIAWSNGKIGPYNPSTLVYQGRLYVLYDRGMVSCYDAKTGAPLYERQRLEESGGFTVSPWAAQGRVYCLDEDGKCYVLKAGDTFEVLHINNLADDDMCMATPALAGKKLILRTAARVYCVSGD